jgi:succinyl-diaminopimelate desuccinylase
VTDFLGLVATLVDIPSVSHHERHITDHLEGLLAPVPWLELVRIGNCLVARTHLGRAQRLLLAGHTDTVPPNGNDRACFEGDVLWGLGSADMKAGVAVLTELARTVDEPAVDVTYVFYDCEEVDSRFNGIERLFNDNPDLLAGDAAVLAEPTGALVEAGCQGTLRVEVTLTGERAHSARSWLGRNAVHRMAPVLAALDAYEGRRVTIDGCEFREGLQAVLVAGGVAANVVPDHVLLTLNHRFAPDRTPEEAQAHLRQVIGPVDGFKVVDMAPAAPPALGHPLLTALLAATGSPARAKLGWTDVARFAARGIPATNFGPGDPNVAHAAGERVERREVEMVYAALRRLLEEGARPEENGGEGATETPGGPARM